MKYCHFLFILGHNYLYLKLGSQRYFCIWFLKGVWKFNGKSLCIWLWMNRMKDWASLVQFVHSSRRIYLKCCSFLFWAYCSWRWWRSSALRAWGMNVVQVDVNPVWCENVIVKCLVLLLTQHNIYLIVISLYFSFGQSDSFSSTVRIKGRRDYRMPSKWTISRLSWRDYNQGKAWLSITNGRQ